MSRLFPAWCAFAAAIVLQLGVSGAAFSQGLPPASPSAGGAPSPGTAGPSPDVSASVPTSAVQPTATPPQLPVLWITSVEVMRSKGEPFQDIVRVRGVTGSPGWTAPELVPLFVGNPADHILDLQFIAEVPAESQPAQGFMPISAILALEPGHPFTGVRVRGADNVVEVTQLPGIAEAKVTIEDCSKCIGKKFAPKGKTAAGAPGVIREEDMPRNFRVIPPHKGVAGITHNMNRLNIVLGDDSETIVWAFWE
jgi:hypothetical protein